MTEKIHLLMSGYFSGTLTESEQKELEQHLESVPSDQKIIDDYRLIWEESGQGIIKSQIDIENALIKTKRRIIFKKTNLVQFFRMAAAVILMAGLFSTVYVHFFYTGSSRDRSDRLVIEQEISTIFGTRSKFQLSDGTTVYLNSGSKLTFPVEFNGENREVKLIGEAFFEVTPNTSQPFIVKTISVNVKVLGTAFDLQAYPNSNEISTTLVHGKVVLESEKDGVTKQLAELKPSERAIYKPIENGIQIMAEEDLDKFIGWKDGKLVFFNDPIDKVAEKLGNWYNITVKIGNNDLKQYRFTATFSDEPVEQVLDLLSKSSPIRYQIREAARLSDNSYSKREIIFN